jgi:PAS domain S-box-containing protein
MSFYNRGSLRSQVALLTLLAVVLAAGFIAWDIHTTRRFLERHARLETRSLAEGVARAVQQALAGAEEAVLGLAEGPATLTRDPAACSRSAARLRGTTGRLANIGAADRTGRVYCSALPIPPDLEVTTGAWLREVMETGTPMLGTYRVGRISGRKALPLAAPVPGPGGRPLGVAFATLDLEHLTEQLGAGLPAGASLAVLDRSGTILARFPDPERFIGRAYSDTALRRAFRAETSGQVTGVGVDGEARLYSFTTLTRPGELGGLTIAVGFRPAEIFAPAAAQAWRSALGVAIALGALILGFWLASRYLLLKPLDSLARAAGRLGAGVLEPEAVDTLPDEMGQVASALDRAQQRIVASQARLAGIIESAMDAIVTVDEEQRIVLFNPAAERAFGYRADQVLGQRLDLLIPERVRLRHRDEIHRFSRERSGGRESRTMGGGNTLWGRHADGHEFPIEASISQLVTADGRFYSAILRDVTERQAAEAALAARAAELEAVLGASPLAVVWVGTDLKVFGWYGTAKKLFGWSSEDVLGRPLPVIPEGYEAEYERLRNKVFSGQPFSGHDTMRRRRDGTLVPVSISTAPICDPGGAVTGLVAVYEDISERRRHEADRERLLAEQARIAGELRALHGRLVAVREDERASIAREIHDQFGSALTALKMDAAWLQRHLGDAADGKAAPRLQGMMDLLDDTIRLGRRLSSELRPPALDLGLAPALESTLEEFARRHGLLATLDAPERLPALRPEASLALFRIVQEALTNVARHAEASEVRVALAANDGHLLLRVEDDGKGLGAIRPSALGLAGMRERAALIGASCEVRARADARGTVVEVRAPVEGAA